MLGIYQKSATASAVQGKGIVPLQYYATAPAPFEIGDKYNKKRNPVELKSPHKRFLLYNIYADIIIDLPQSTNYFVSILLGSNPHLHVILISLHVP